MLDLMIHVMSRYKSEAFEDGFIIDVLSLMEDCSLQRNWQSVPSKLLITVDCDGLGYFMFVYPYQDDVIHEEDFVCCPITYNQAAKLSNMV